MAWRWLELAALLAAALKVVIALHVIGDQQERHQQLDRWAAYKPEEHLDSKPGN